MRQRARLHVSELDEARLEGEDVGIGQRERLRLPFPVDHPVGSRPPAIAIDKQRELAVVEQKLAVESLDVDRLEVLFARHEIERGVGLVKQRLPVERLDADDLEAARTAHAQLRSQEMDRGRFRGNENFLSKVVGSAISLGALRAWGAKCISSPCTA